MKVLLVKMSSLGDLVHALPAVTEAARRQVRFHWVAEEAFTALPASHSGVERVLPIAWRRWRKSLWRSRMEMRAFLRSLAGERYDLVLDAQGLLKSALLASRARGRERAGFSRTSAREPAAAWFCRRAIAVPKERHAIERQRQLFAEALGYPYREDQPLEFGLPPSEPRADRCLFLHGASWPTKLWPEAMWVDLARRAAAAGLRVALPWGNAAERARAARIAQAGGAALLPALTLAQLMEELRQARLAVGVDSGPMHLAAALGVPTLALLGSTSSALTGCRGSRARSLQAHFSCAPCLSRKCRYRGPAQRWQGAAMAPACYAGLHPEIVWAAAQDLLASGQRGLHSDAS